MLKDLIKHVGSETGLTQAKTRAALGVVFNAAERQGSPFAAALFQRLPGARTLSAKTGVSHGAATGEIARLIEQTPGGRRHVVAEMFRTLHSLGLGHQEVGKILPAVSDYVETVYGMKGFGHLGDLIGTDLDVHGRSSATLAA